MIHVNVTGIITVIQTDAVTIDAAQDRVIVRVGNITGEAVLGRTKDPDVAEFHAN